MFHVPDYYEDVSLKLSTVLEEIAVNERTVLKRRRTNLINETIDSITETIWGFNHSVYYFGSQSEGTTTEGLDSDLDTLYCNHKINIIQDWAQWKPGFKNLLMIQDEVVTPGYCFLQVLRDDAPLPCSEPPQSNFMFDSSYIKDRNGRLLLQNIGTYHGIPEGDERHGPSWLLKGDSGFLDQDKVDGHPCASWPLSATRWLERNSSGNWPTPDVKRYAMKSTCFVVGVGSKVSENIELEWRISSSLAERCLMFNLNITQIRCYVLMKMILKRFLNPSGRNNLSSFMCKTVLLHCVEKSSSTIWQTSNLLKCLTKCLQTLFDCIVGDYLPHFIVTENNLMAGQFPVTAKEFLLENVFNFIHSNGLALMAIKTDDLGERLQIKINMIPQTVRTVTSPIQASIKRSGILLRDIALTINQTHKKLLMKTILRSTEETLQILLKCISKLQRYHRNGNSLEKVACSLIAPPLCSSVGSVMASSNISEGTTISEGALEWLSAGINSDISSGRLKQASVFYCSKDFYKTEEILKCLERRCNATAFESVCCCSYSDQSYLRQSFLRACYEQNEVAIQNNILSCLRFLHCEMNCLPFEMRYELYRQGGFRIAGRTIPTLPGYCSWALVDSLPYLYFLQYKTYGHLKMRHNQQQALKNLLQTIKTEHNLGHREVALNLLGQCWEQEGKIENALCCYISSIKLLEMNNSARWHLCKLLAKISNLKSFADVFLRM